jgi:hypothetical protein
MREADPSRMLGWIYTSMLLTALAFIVIRGEWEERLAVMAMLFVGYGTYHIYAQTGHKFDEFSSLLVANEAVLLLVSLFVAYRSNRFWPLPFAALEIAVFLSLLAPLFGRNLVSYAMGVAQGLWAYPQLLILLMAVIRARNRGRWNSSPNS